MFKVKNKIDSNEKKEILFARNSLCVVFSLKSVLTRRKENVVVVFFLFKFIVVRNFDVCSSLSTLCFSINSDRTIDVKHRCSKIIERWPFEGVDEKLCEPFLVGDNWFRSNRSTIDSEEVRSFYRDRVANEDRICSRPIKSAATNFAGNLL